MTKFLQDLLFKGTVTLSTFVGSGTRMVVAGADGKLSTQTIPTSSITGSGTANYAARWLTATTLGDSAIYDNGSIVAIGTASPNAQSRLTLMGSSTYSKSIVLDSTWNYQTSFAMKNGIYSTEFNLGGSSKSTNEGGPGSLQVSTYNSSTGQYRYPITFFANSNVSFGGTGSSVPADNGSTVQVNGSFYVSTLAGTGTRMVVASATGVLSTQEIPSGSGAEADTLDSVTDRGAVTTNAISVGGLTSTGITLTSNGNLTTSNGFYGLTTNYADSIFVGWDSSAVYLGYQMGSLPIHVGTNGTGEIRFRNSGGFKIDSFAGTGSRMLVTDSSGVLSTQGLDTLNSVTTRGDSTTNKIEIGGIYATSARTTNFVSETNYFVHKRILSSGVMGFKLNTSGADTSFWRWNDATGDVEFGNATNYGLQLYVNNSVAAKIFNNGNLFVGSSPADSGYKVDVDGTIRSNVYWSSNGTLSAPVVAFNTSNKVVLDVQGYGAVTMATLGVGGQLSVGGIVASAGSHIVRGGTTSVNTPFVSYGIGRPDADYSLTNLAGVGGYYSGTAWYNGIGLSLFVAKGTDITGGTSSFEAVKITPDGALVVGSLAEIGTYDSGSGGSNINSYLSIEGHNADGYGDGVVLTYSRGTKASPATVQTGDLLGGYYFKAYSNGVYANQSYIESQVTGMGTFAKTNLQFATASGGNQGGFIWMTLDEDGKLIVANPGQFSDVGDYKLQVNGNGYINGNLSITSATGGAIEFFPEGGSNATYSWMRAKLGSGLAPTLAWYGDVSGAYKAYGIYGPDSTYDGLLIYREAPTLADVILMGATKIALPSTQRIIWSSSTNVVDTPDLGLAREAAGLLQINNSSLNTYASLKLLNLTATGLAGSGTRMVTVDNNGLLGAQAIPSGGTGSSTLSGLSDVAITSVANNQLLKYDSGTGKWINWTPNYLTSYSEVYLGTVTSVSVVSANGFAGSVATSTSTPAITILTTVTGILKGNGTAISAAVAGTDYLTSSDLSGYLTSATAASTYQPLDGDLTAIAALSGTSGFLKKTAANTWTLDTNTYLTSYTEIYQGTVTSVAALTLGTTGTDLSSSVATGTTTPVITLNVPTASASNRGALSSTDWSTFNSKQAGSTNLTSLSGLTYASTSFVKMTAAGTFALDTNTYYLASNPSGYTTNTGTVTTVSVTTANGISGTVATAGTTPAITLSLGAITPTSVNSVVISGSATPTLAVTGTSSISGSNTGDNAVNSLYSGLVSNATHTGDATGATALTVVGLRGVALPALGASAGLLKYTGTGTNTWVFDTSVYLTANQSITLSGAVSGSGTTAITTTLANSVVGVANLSATGTPSASTYLRGDNTWATISAEGGGGYTVTSQTTTYSVTATSGTTIVKGDTTGGTFTITLPTAVGNTATIIIKKTAGSAALVIDGAGTETIDGGLTATINKVYESVTLISDNANWQIV